VPSTSTLTTTRLCLRPWQASDLAPFARLNADPRVMQFMPKLLTQAESDAVVSRITAHFDRHGFGLWAVEVIESKTTIGFVGLSVPAFEAHFTPCVEIGWRLAYDHWGQGYASEGAKAALGFAFRELRLDEVLSFTTLANQRSRAVMERIGMSHSPEDDFDHPNLAPDHPLCRHVLYRLSRSVWESQASAQIK
jgi:RimJ/RimL family protein N-acetyltransferase